MITALNRVNVEQDCQLLVERLEKHLEKDMCIERVFPGTKQASFPRTRWNTRNFSAGKTG